MTANAGPGLLAFLGILGGLTLGMAAAFPDTFLWGNAALVLLFQAVAARDSMRPAVGCRGCGRSDGLRLPDGSCWWCAEPRPMRHAMPHAS